MAKTTSQKKKRPDPKHDRWETTMKQHRALKARVSFQNTVIAKVISRLSDVEDRLDEILPVLDTVQ